MHNVIHEVTLRWVDVVPFVFLLLRYSRRRNFSHFEGNCLSFDEKTGRSRSPGHGDTWSIFPKLKFLRRNSRCGDIFKFPT